MTTHSTPTALPVPQSAIECTEADAARVSYEVEYRPIPYGAIPPPGTCTHGPEFCCDLGFRLEPTGRRGGRKIARDGWICLRCGQGQYDGAEDWWDLWHIAVALLSGKCSAFAIRLSELAHAAHGSDDLRPVFQMIVQRYSALQAAVAPDQQDIVG